MFFLLGTVGSHLSEHIGTKGWSDKRKVQKTEYIEISTTEDKMEACSCIFVCLHVLL